MKFIISALLSLIRAQMPATCTALRECTVTADGIVYTGCHGQCGYDEVNPGNAFTKYHGKQTVTKTGKTCQAWNVNTPHNHIYASEPINTYYTRSEYGLQSNYCRNPNDSRPGKIWCYTTDPAVEWEECDPIDSTGTVCEAEKCCDFPKGAHISIVGVVPALSLKPYDAAAHTISKNIDNNVSTMSDDKFKSFRTVYFQYADSKCAYIYEAKNYYGFSIIEELTDTALSTSFTDIKGSSRSHSSVIKGFG